MYEDVKAVTDSILEGKEEVNKLEDLYDEDYMEYFSEVRLLIDAGYLRYGDFVRIVSFLVSEDDNFREEFDRQVYSIFGEMLRGNGEIGEKFTVRDISDLWDKVIQFNYTIEEITVDFNVAILSFIEQEYESSWDGTHTVIERVVVENTEGLNKKVVAVNNLLCKLYSCLGILRNYSEEYCEEFLRENYIIKEKYADLPPMECEKLAKKARQSDEGYQSIEANAALIEKGEGDLSWVFYYSGRSIAESFRHSNGQLFTRVTEHMGYDLYGSSRRSLAILANVFLESAIELVWGEKHRVKEYKCLTQGFLHTFSSFNSLLQKEIQPQFVESALCFFKASKWADIRGREDRKIKHLSLGFRYLSHSKKNSVEKYTKEVMEKLINIHENALYSIFLQLDEESSQFQYTSFSDIVSIFSLHRYYIYSYKAILAECNGKTSESKMFSARAEAYKKESKIKPKSLKYKELSVNTNEFDELLSKSGTGIEVSAAEKTIEYVKEGELEKLSQYIKNNLAEETIYNKRKYRLLAENAENLEVRAILFAGLLRESIESSKDIRYKTLSILASYIYYTAYTYRANNPTELYDAAEFLYELSDEANLKEKAKIWYYLSKGKRKFEEEKPFLKDFEKAVEISERTEKSFLEFQSIKYLLQYSALSNEETYEYILRLREIKNKNKNNNNSHKYNIRCVIEDADISVNNPQKGEYGTVLVTRISNGGNAIAGSGEKLLNLGPLDVEPGSFVTIYNFKNGCFCICINEELITEKYVNFFKSKYEEKDISQIISVSAENKGECFG